jgi:hypothetical protein
LINGKVPGSWKGALSHRIPTKDNIPRDPSTWRDISLLPTVYNIFMKCLLGRILPLLVDTGILSPKQKAYIYRQGVNEHVFCLKTGVDDFKHESCKLYMYSWILEMPWNTIPQNDAECTGGDTLPHHVYKGSFLHVICGHQLTEPIPLQLLLGRTSSVSLKLNCRCYLPNTIWHYGTLHTTIHTV